MNDIYRLLVVAVACNLSCEQAYDMVLQDFIDGFAQSYEKLSPDGKPSVLDALIEYTIYTLKVQSDVERNILYELRSKRADIINTFIGQSLSDMLTVLASRQSMKDRVRGYLRRENVIQSMYSKVNSSRIDQVFLRFLETFRTSSAYAFQFRGSFPAFVMNSFKYFYTGLNCDIWALIRETDVAKRELEKDIVVAKDVEQVREDDLPIHDLLVNISLVNDLMFKHSGSKLTKAYGVQYDIVYLLICELCRRRVDELNTQYGEKILEFVDPYDRKEAWLGLLPNKGIAAKIRNAKELIPYVFEYVRKGELSTSNLFDLRCTCFTLGKHDREGRNCVWRDITPGGETARYLDRSASEENYRHFDEILKGVVSAYTLLSEMERRGMFLVDNYCKDLYQDKSLIRYLDYLSSIQHIDLIRELQGEPVEDPEFKDNGLYEFDEMVYHYIGSAVNTTPENRERQYHAAVYGFFHKPKLKQTVAPTTVYEELRQVCCALESLPRGFTEYLEALTVQERARAIYDRWSLFPITKIASGKYKVLTHNMYVTAEPDRASYYLLGSVFSKDTSPQLALDDLHWSLVRTAYPAIVYGGHYGIFIPLERKFFFVGREDKVDQLFCGTMDEIIQVLNNNRLSATPANIEVSLIEAPLYSVGILQRILPMLTETISFSTYIGLNGIDEFNVQKAVGDIIVPRKYRKMIQLYVTWLGENAKIQHSLTELLKTMLLECIYVASCPDAKAIPAEERIYWQHINQGLLTGEFTNEALNWCLTKMFECKTLKTAYWANSSFDYTDIDRTLLTYIFTPELAESKNQPYTDLIEVLARGKDPAEKFVLAFNFVYTRLDFLRYLRDAYSIVFDALPREATALVTELNMRFNIGTKFKNFCDSTITYGIRTTTVSYTDVKSDIFDWRIKSVKIFNPLVKALLSYLQECDNELAKLLDYSVVAQESTNLKFIEWGKAFDIMPRYDGFFELEELRKIADIDSSGFFLLHGRYFKGYSDMHSYYVHKSGRLLQESSGKLKPIEFDFSNPDEGRRYSAILRRGLYGTGGKN